MNPLEEGEEIEFNPKEFLLPQEGSFQNKLNNDYSQNSQK